MSEPTFIGKLVEKFKDDPEFVREQKALEVGEVNDQIQHIRTALEGKTVTAPLYRAGKPPSEMEIPDPAYDKLRALWKERVYPCDVGYNTDYHQSAEQYWENAPEGALEGSIRFWVDSSAPSFGWQDRYSDAYAEGLRSGKVRDQAAADALLEALKPIDLLPES